MKYPDDFIGANKDWLYQQYVVNKKTMECIAKDANCSRSFIHHQLKRYNIFSRNSREVQVLNREDDGFIFNESVINGCLLGDASLGITNKSSILAAPYFRKSNKFLEHMEYVAQFLFENPNNKIYQQSSGMFEIRTLTHDILKPLYEKWYPEKTNFIKTIPTDLKLDKDVLLHWFLDDGTCSWNESKITRSSVIFCTECFSKQDQQNLCDKIFDIFSLNAFLSPRNSGCGYRIRIPTEQSNLFFEIIGEPPVDALSYKWKIQENVIKNKLRDADWLYNEYFTLNKSVDDIANETSTSTYAVYMAVHRFKNTKWLDKNTKRKKKG